MKPTNRTLHIQGMTCVSCELLIKDELEQITSINKIEICHKTNKAEIEFTDNFDLQHIKQIIEKLGYKTSEQPFISQRKKLKPSKKQWLFAIVIILILYKLYTWLQKSGFLSMFETSESIGYGAAFLIGIVASLSTCLAIIGAVVLSFGAKYQTNGTKFERTIKPHLLFHVGRIATFFLLGGILGILGSVFSFSINFMAFLSIIIAIILIWLGLNIIGLVPSMTQAGLHLPKSIMKYWRKIENSDHHYAPIILGALTFFLPCGFTQSMQLFAMSSGSFWTGAITLTMFALGTTPVLLGIGIFSSKTQKKENILLKLVIGIIIILFGWYTFASALAVFGISLPSLSNTKSSTTQSTPSTQYQSVEQIQNVYMTVDYTGYTPNTIRIKNNVPVRWIIDVKQISGCTNEIIIPNLKLSKPLVPGQNIVTFTPKKKGRLGFSCWMGMVRGTFIVE